MTRYRRRAYSLIYLLMALPLITAIASGSYLVAAAALQAEGREQRRVNLDAIARAVVRRIQVDARQARSAQLGSGDVASELILEQPGRRVSYRGVDGRITRSCSIANAAPTVFEWKLSKDLVEFRLETIHGSPAIVWITFTQECRQQANARLTRRVSAAAPIGQGGRP